MRATLVGGALLVLLVALGAGVIQQVGSGRRTASGWLEAGAPAAGGAPEPAPEALARPASPAAPPPSGRPRVLTAGEVSVLDADAPEPMVRYVDAAGSVRMVRGLARVPAEHRANAVVLGRANVNLVDVPAPTAVAFRDWQPEANPNRHEVVLFGAPWCAACERAKRHLDRRGIRYDERDIDSDEAARRRVLDVVGQIAIPLLEVDGRYISGFRPDVYDRALGSG